MNRKNNIKKIKYLLHSNQMHKLKEIIAQLLPIDILDILIKLNKADRLKLFDLIPDEIAGLILDEADSDIFQELIDMLDTQRISKILAEMSTDDIADIMYNLPDEKKAELIALMDVEGATDIIELLRYDEKTAGGIMSKDFIAIRKDMTVQQAINELRNNAPDAETVYYVYVVDNNDILVGVVSLRELIVSDPEQRIENIMRTNVISVLVNTDQEKVAKTVAKYDFLAIPVINKVGKILGIITVDDVLDVIEEEATEDMQMIGGSSEIEYYDTVSILTIIKSVKARLPWLIITLFGGMISSRIISNYSDLLNSQIALASFMPLLAGMGGNVGTQSSTLTVRGIATGQLDSLHVAKIILQESFVGFLIGLICGLIISVATFMTHVGNLILPVIVGSAMCANMITAATIGTLMPFIFKKIGIDPAVASAPFISTTIDITGLSIYFGLTTFLIKYFI